MMQVTGVVDLAEDVKDEAAFNFGAEGLLVACACHAVLALHPRRRVLRHALQGHTPAVPTCDATARQSQKSSSAPVCVMCFRAASSACVRGKIPLGGHPESQYLKYL